MPKLGRFVLQTLSWGGRASRKTLYASIGLLYLIGFLLLPLQVVRFASSNSQLTWFLDILLFPVSIAVAVFLVGALIRRLHDRNRSGWSLLIFFGPHAALLAGTSVIPEAEQRLLTLALIVGFFIVAPFMVWGVAEIFILRGVNGANRYGPDPLDLAQSAKSSE
jgi:uncharacterized membrane protein YhaH (DUF805 family)